MSQQDYPVYPLSPMGKAPIKSTTGLRVTLIVLGSLFVVCIGGIGVLTLLAAAGNSSTPEESNEGPISNSNNQENPPANDVTLTGCEINEFGWPMATLDVTNNSSESSDYHISVEVTDPQGNRLDEMFVFIEALHPGQAAQQEAQGLEEVSGTITCTVLSVDRYSSE